MIKFLVYLWVYAPVGNHRDLLPYLVRRLLENGANSSFVNRFLDSKVPPPELLQDPVDETRSHEVARHSRIPVPREIYREEDHPWANAAGIDLADPILVKSLLETVMDTVGKTHTSTPVVGGQRMSGQGKVVLSPADNTRVVGELIEAEARQMLERHEHRMRSDGKLLATCELDPSHAAGYFIAPQVYEIQRLAELEQEVFGPILHVIRYPVSDMPKILADINASGYGLTLGVHSRIDGFAREVFGATRVGNTYINRNMVGAVVGVNPFGVTLDLL